MSKMTFKEAKKIAEEKFPHPTELWKREIWIKKLMEPELSAQQMMDIHVILEEMAALTAKQGIDSTKAEKRKFKKEYNELVNRIKEISPEYYDTIKIQDE